MVIFKILLRFIKIFLISGVFLVVFSLTILWEKVTVFLPLKRRPSRKPVQLKRFLERLQYTFIKLGQILAMRHDFLPEEYCTELMSLLDDARPFKDKKAVKIIEKELGESIEVLFRSFDRNYIAAASFGQVYQAVLPDGQKVAVKVLRPGIRPLVHAELRFLRHLTRLVDFLCLLGTLRLEPFARDFIQYTKEEMDYRQEAKYIRKIQLSKVKNPLEKIPRVYTEYSTGKVLTLEFLEGVWMNKLLYAINTGDKEKLEEYKNKGVHLPTVAKNLMINSLVQAFEKNYYHADPHAANLCIMENNVIGYVDFGIVGRLDKRFKDSTLQYLRALFMNNVDLAYYHFLDIIQPPDYLNLKGFEREIKALMLTWLEDVGDPAASLGERSALRRMVKEGKIMRKYNLYFPLVTSRFYRLLMISDMIVLKLDPHLDVQGITTRYLDKLVIAEWKEKLRRVNYKESLLEGAYLVATLPQRIETMLTLSEEFIRRSGKAIKKVRTIPANISSFLGTLSFFSALALFISHMVWDFTLELEVAGIEFTTMETCLALLVVRIITIWLTRYLISR